MKFRLEAQPRRDPTILSAALWALRGDEWKVVAVGTFLATEFDAFADLLEFGGAEVIRNDAEEPKETP